MDHTCSSPGGTLSSLHVCNLLQITFLRSGRVFSSLVLLQFAHGVHQSIFGGRVRRRERATLERTADPSGAFLNLHQTVQSREMGRSIMLQQFDFVFADLRASLENARDRGGGGRVVGGGVLGRLVRFAGSLGTCGRFGICGSSLLGRYRARVVVGFGGSLLPAVREKMRNRVRD